MPRNHFILVTTASVFLLLALGAAPPASSAPPGEAATKPAPSKEKVEVDGAAVYRGSCNRCHNSRAIEELDPARWEMVVTHMQVRGSLPARDVAALMLWMNPPAADWTGDALKAFPDVPLLVEHCTRCHNVDRIQEALEVGRDRTWWAGTLTRMRSYGANLKPKEESSLTEALTTRASSPKE